MSRIAILGEEETEYLLEHLEANSNQVSKQFGGTVDYTWDQYELELREFCKENEDRLCFTPQKKNNKEKTSDDSYSVSHYSETSIADKSSSPEISTETPHKSCKKKLINISLSMKKSRDKDLDKSRTEESQEGSHKK